MLFKIITPQSGKKDFIYWVNLKHLVWSLPAEENLVLYVCITFAELKRLDILWSDKLLRTSCIKIDTALTQSNPSSK